MGSRLGTGFLLGRPAPSGQGWALDSTCSKEASAGLGMPDLGGWMETTTRWQPPPGSPAPLCQQGEAFTSLVGVLAAASRLGHSTPEPTPSKRLPPQPHPQATTCSVPMLLPGQLRRP